MGMGILMYIEGWDPGRQACTQHPWTTKALLAHSRARPVGLAPDALTAKVFDFVLACDVGWVGKRGGQSMAEQPQTSYREGGDNFWRGSFRGKFY